MKKFGIINAQLAGYIAALGHKDRFMIADAGMPIPKDIPIVDLALVCGVPDFIQVMDAVLNEACVEAYMLADEIKDNNPRLLAYIEEKLPGLPCEYVSHEKLKKLSSELRFVIRTGEASPYPNVILSAGVVF